MPHPRPAAPLWVLIAPLLGTALLWSAMLFVISFVSGWRKLARAYPLGQRLPPPAEFGWQPGSIGVLRANYRFNLSADAEAMYLQASGPFRIGHPAIRAPWNEIQVNGTSKVLWYEFVELRLLRVPAIPIRLPAKAFRALRERLADVIEPPPSMPAPGPGG